MKKISRSSQSIWMLILIPSIVPFPGWSFSTLLSPITDNVLTKSVGQRFKLSIMNVQTITWPPHRCTTCTHALNNKLKMHIIRNFHFSHNFAGFFHCSSCSFLVLLRTTSYLRALNSTQRSRDEGDTRVGVVLVIIISL